MEICPLTLDILFQQKPDKPKKKWFQKEESVEDVISFLEQTPLDVPAQPPIEDDVKQIKLENEPSELGHSEAAEPVVAEASPAVAVEYPPSPSPSSCRPEMSEETAAIMIQTAFRGYTVLLIIFHFSFSIGVLGD